MFKIKKKEEKDRCVLCWRETPYNKKVPIKKRKYYVEEAGQLCKDCHKAIYKKRN